MLASVSFCSLTTVFFRPATLQCCTRLLPHGVWAGTGEVSLISIPLDAAPGGHFNKSRSHHVHQTHPGSLCKQGGRCPIKSIYLNRMIFIKQSNHWIHYFTHSLMLSGGTCSWIHSENMVTHSWFISYIQGKRVEGWLPGTPDCLKKYNSWIWIYFFILRSALKSNATSLTAPIVPVL